MRINAPPFPLDAPQTEGAEGAEVPTTTTTNFATVLGRFVSEVDGQQRLAEQESAKLANGGGNVHETALALEKADIEMRLLLKGRNKILEAYQEISRMPV